MVVCKFFLQGNCRFGQNCRNDHPGGGNGGNQGQNRFAALSPNNAGGNRSGGLSSADLQTIARDVPIDLDENKSRPKWIFSSYGPLKTSSASLMTDNEYSPEEIRLRYYQAASAGNGNQADQEATQMYNKINQDYKNILNNVNDISKFLDDAERKRPNRHDFTNVALFNGTVSREAFERSFETNGNNSAGGGFGGGSAFGQNTSNNNPFGKPPTSTFGQAQAPSAFGGNSTFGQSGFGSNASGSNAPAFGQSSTPAFGQSAFGKPSLGSSSSGFGQPAFGSSGFGQTAPKNPFAPASASGGFGAPAAAFGQPAQPSTFGQPSQPTSTFGQSPASNSAFGQPSQTQSTFGQPTQPTSAFGQPSQPTSAFGQPSQPTSAFGQTNKPSSGFGQAQQSTSPFGQAQQPSTGFGQANTATSAFGQTSQPSVSGFGQPAFGQPSQTNSAFGQASKTSSGFGTAFGQPATNGFGGNSSNTAFSQQNAQPEPAPATGMVTESTQSARPNPFGVRQSSSAQATPQPSTGTGLGAINPINPLIGKTAAPLHITQTLPSQPPQTGIGGKLSSYRGQRTTYAAMPDKYVDSQPVPQDPVLCYKRPDTGEEEKIWHPAPGSDPALAALNKDMKKLDFQAKDEKYTEEVTGQYRTLYETARFELGRVPCVPPKREWVAYDF